MCRFQALPLRLPGSQDLWMEKIPILSVLGNEFTFCVVLLKPMGAMRIWMMRELESSSMSSVCGEQRGSTRQNGSSCTLIPLLLVIFSSQATIHFLSFSCSTITCFSPPSSQGNHCGNDIRGLEQGGGRKEQHV